MPDPTPPADRPLTPEARARIRAQLLETAQADTSDGSRGRRWLIPAAVAAAVVLVAGMAAAVVRLGGDGSAGGPAGGVATSHAPAPRAPSDRPSDRPSDESGAPSLPASKRPGAKPDHPRAGQVSSPGCAAEVRGVLPGARKVAAADQTSFWTAGRRFVLCDDRAGTTTVHHPLPLTPGEGVAAYRVSSVYPPWPHSSAVIRVAGGIVPEGVTAFDVTYTFPNGGTQHAETTTDEQGRTWWRMLYAYDDGGGNELRKPPITVRVSYSGGQKTYELRWGLDTCAQANHGC